MTPVEQTVANILELEQRILSKHPQMPQLLSIIHRQLKQDPEIVTLLEPQHIATIVSGLQAHTKTTLIAKVMNDGTKKKSLRATTEDDI